MKKLLAIGIACLALASLASAQSSEFYSLMPKDTRSMAMGGTFTALTDAYMGFYGNPAAFASKNGDLLISVNPWTYIRPNSETINGALAVASDDADPLAFLGSVLQDNGFGAGASFGIGYAGHGLGLGAFLTTDEYIPRGTIAEATIESDTQANFVVGIGIPLQLGGLRLQVGADLRPFFRMRTQAAAASIVEAAANGADIQAEIENLRVISGFGLAADLGASLQLGPLGLGLAIRDIAPSFTMVDSPLYALRDAGGPVSADAPDSYEVEAKFLPQISAGLSFKPRFMPGLIDPALYIDLIDPIKVIREEASVFNLLHAGAEVRLLSFVYLRGGINRGWLSAGAGLRLLFLDVDMAVFTEELGALPGDNPRSGMAFKLAFRL